MTIPDITIRPWRDGDDTRLIRLLDAKSDLLWQSQFQALHGPDRLGDRWRSTRFAEQSGEIVGVASIAANPIHPGRYSAAIQVGFDWRNLGIGTRLLRTLMESRPDPLPLSTKIMATNDTAMRFADARNGHVYQVAPLISLDPGSPGIRSWIDEALEPTNYPISSLVRVDAATIAQAFVEQYKWVHQDWSPVGSEDALRTIATLEVGEVDRELSTGVWSNGCLEAIVLAFRADDDGVEVVAETVGRDVANGEEILKISIATLLSACVDRGISRVEFDGHIDDPHLYPVLRTIPETRSSPLNLVEFT